MDFSQLTFGQRLRLARERAGVTQKALSGILGIAQNQISVWEAGTNGPKRERLPIVAAAVGVSVDWLLTGEGNLPERMARDHPAPRVKPAKRKHA